MNATLCSPFLCGDSAHPYPCQRALGKQGQRVTQLSPPAGPPGVLVVDDEGTVRSLLRAVLEKLGWRVWQAADGPEALRLYRLYRSQIALVLLDVRMPGWDGPRTLAAMQRLNPNLPCCFMSAETGGYTVAELYGRSALGFLAKPFSLTQVAQTIGRLARFEPAAAI